jgi:hypothetical protein
VRFSESTFLIAAAILHAAIPLMAYVVDRPEAQVSVIAPAHAEIEIEIEPHALPDLPQVMAPEPMAAVDPQRPRDTPETPPDPAIERPTARNPADDPYATVPLPEVQPAPTSSGQAPQDQYDPLTPDPGGGGVLTGPPGIGRPVWAIPGVLPEAPRPAPAPTTPTAPRAVDPNIAGKVLDEKRRERDKALGLDLPAAGTVASAIGAAVRGGETPNEGRATFVVRLSSAGKVLDVRVASASAGSKDVWERAAKAAASRLSGKTLPMTGEFAAGATVYVDVSSAVSMPSGGKGGVHRQGTGIGFDLSDIGANPTRVVRTSFRVVPAK